MHVWCCLAASNPGHFEKAKQMITKPMLARLNRNLNRKDEAMIYKNDGTLWGEDVLGRDRAERLNRAFDRIPGEPDPERVFDGAPRTLEGFRKAAKWAAENFGPDYRRLVDALK